MYTTVVKMTNSSLAIVCNRAFSALRQSTTAPPLRPRDGMLLAANLAVPSTPTFNGELLGRFLASRDFQVQNPKPPQTPFFLKPWNTPTSTTIISAIDLETNPESLLATSLHTQTTSLTIHLDQHHKSENRRLSSCTPTSSRVSVSFPPAGFTAPTLNRPPFRLPELSPSSQRG
ncbi:hypothetical protein B0T21DRAFT_84299 [Apiosordaria backusii]|uniref:Uncharacterized protein n=1 Tax=Apiosordaria backusii TaxID=314023 RepID=A0AA40A446_9PEZI|nr:hypothetical protein B0T21DRAFT_84299 [Apiosordaria backusii]